MPRASSERSGILELSRRLERAEGAQRRLQMEAELERLRAVAEETRKWEKREAHWMQTRGQGLVARVESAREGTNSPGGGVTSPTEIPVSTAVEEDLERRRYVDSNPNGCGWEGCERVTRVRFVDPPIDNQHLCRSSAHTLPVCTVDTPVSSTTPVPGDTSVFVSTPAHHNNMSRPLSVPYYDSQP